MGPLGVLQVVFLTLKLCALVTWSWWAVLIPTWVAMIWHGAITLVEREHGC